MLRIKLRFADVDAMVRKFAPNVGTSGLFLPTKALQPIGDQVKFELRLADDKVVLFGMGTVVDAREPDPEDPRAAFGIGIELSRVTREGRALILRMLERRRELGIDDIDIPYAEDVDVARDIEREALAAAAEAAGAPADRPRGGTTPAGSATT
ncbi:MAG: hypothetical protein KIT31_27465, partial [Deltaproteobacteria bacterium]|nr:hypothetical protein [Deltaproteobacteria bacterium]